MREHNCHPLLVWRDADVELSEKEFWVGYDFSRIVSEAAMLDLRRLAVAIRGLSLPDSVSLPPQLPVEQHNPDNDDASEDDILRLRPIDLSTGKAVLSLQDMINTTVALKSNLDLEVIQPSSQWPYALFAGTSGSLSESPNDAQPQLSVLQTDQNAAHVAQAISGLQRQILLLRSDLNFELWLSRENSKHIERLYQDRVLMKTAEDERQGLVCVDFAIQGWAMFIRSFSTINCANIAHK